jgi:hypothetical protein
MGKTEKSKGKPNQELKNTSASLVTAMAVEACLGASAPGGRPRGGTRRSASLSSAMAVVDNLAPISGASTDPRSGISDPRRSKGESRSAAAYEDKVEGVRWMYPVRLYRLVGEQSVSVHVVCYRGRKVYKYRVKNANCTARISNML